MQSDTLHLSINMVHVDTKQWVTAPEKAGVVRCIYSLRQQSANINDIAKILNWEKF